MGSTPEVCCTRYIRDTRWGCKEETPGSVELCSQERELPEGGERFAALELIDPRRFHAYSPGQIICSHMADLARPGEGQGVDGRSRHRSTSWRLGMQDAAECLPF